MSAPNSTQRTAAETSGVTRFANLLAGLMRGQWVCPNEQRLAEFADGVLPDRLRSPLEFHLSHCQRCRVLLSDVIKAKRESDPVFPSLAVIQKAEAICQRTPTVWQWMRVPLAAFATATIILVAIFFVLRKPQELAHSLTPTVSSPPAANVGHGTAPAETLPDVERKPLVHENSPIVLFPRSRSVIRERTLTIRWRPISGSPLYRVTLTTSNGDLVWEGQSEAASLEIPANVDLKDGAYFVWIAADTTDGRTLKSIPVRFELKR